MLRILRAKHIEHQQNIQLIQIGTISSVIFSSYSNKKAANSFSIDGENRI
jgi:hypothetical protein